MAAQQLLCQIRLGSTWAWKLLISILRLVLSNEDDGKLSYAWAAIDEKYIASSLWKHC
jgi:hypothetical protein